MTIEEGARISRISEMEDRLVKRESMTVLKGSRMKNYLLWLRRWKSEVRRIYYGGNMMGWCSICVSEFQLPLEFITHSLVEHDGKGTLLSISCPHPHQYYTGIYLCQTDNGLKRCPIRNVHWRPVDACDARCPGGSSGICGSRSRLQASP